MKPTGKTSSALSVSKTQQAELWSAYNCALVQKTVNAIWAHYDRDLALIPAGHRNSRESFAQVGAVVIKVSSESVTGGLSFNFARNTVTYRPDRVNISISPATEADLLDAKKFAAANGTGADQVRIREFLRIVRNESAQPLKIHVVNADQVGASGKAIKILRDDVSGKISGAISQTLPASLEDG